MFVTADDTQQKAGGETRCIDTVGTEKCGRNLCEKLSKTQREVGGGVGVRRLVVSLFTNFYRWLLISSDAATCITRGLAFAFVGLPPSSNRDGTMALDMTLAGGVCANRPERLST